MFENINLNIKDYINSSLKFCKVDWWNLPDHINLRLNKFPNEIKRLGNFITVKRLKKIKKKEKINRNIIAIKKEMCGNTMFKVSFPILLKNKEYVKLYALMISEGSYRTEFSLHVPEKEFHVIFKNCIKSLISKEAMNFIKSAYSKGFLRSRAPAIIRHLIPIPSQIPYIILKNKEFAKEYLKIAFEAEGSPIFNEKQHKRYIKLSRYVDVTHFVSKERFPLNKRIYIRAIKKNYSELLNKIINKPPKILQGEQILLKHHFDINGKLQLEAIRKNKTSLRCGKITARWVLFIYANNIDKFIKEIGFISKTKNEKLKEMKKIKGNRPQYYTLNIIKKVSDKKGYFYRKDFVKEMKKLKYVSPQCYLWKYSKKGIIKRIRRAYYKVLF